MIRRSRRSHSRAKRGGRAALWLAVALAVGVGIAIVVVAIGFDRAGTPEPRRRPSVPIEELATPGALTDQERAGGLDRLDEATVALAEGGWVQVADESGRLAQQYSARRMEPLPQRWVQMEAPRALLYGREGRVVTLEGDSGRVQIPRRAIESGSLTGAVVIGIHRPPPGVRADPQRDPPQIVIRADEASFDQLEGVVRCPEGVRFEAPGLEFEGEGLTMLLASDGRTFERLVIDRATAPIRVTRAEGAAGPRRERPAPAAPPSEPPRTAPAEGAAGAEPAAAPRAIPAAPPPQPETAFYRLVLDEGVVITRTSGPDRTVLRGDRLEAVFALASGGFDALAAAPPGGAVLAPREWLLAAAIAQVATAPPEAGEPELIEIEFGGRLVMTPLGPGEPRLASADDVLLIVEGEPVEIEDERRGATIRGERLVYRGAEERLEIRSGSAPVRVEAPGLDLAAGSLDADLLAGTVDLAGPGTLRLDQQGAAPADGADGAAAPLWIEWRDALDLQTGRDGRGLERALFRGEVGVFAEGLVLGCDRLAVAFAAGEPAAAGGDDPAIERIEASGGVRAQRPGASAGRLDADTLVVEFLPNPAGEASPRRVLAEGAVRALDERHLVWADRVEATLAEGASGASGEGADADSQALLSSGLAIDRIWITALPESQVALVQRDGAAILAAAVQGDRPGGSVGIDGPDLAIVRDGTILDRLDRLELSEDSEARRASAAGGRLRAIEGVLLPIEWPEVRGLPEGERVRPQPLAWPAPPPRPDPSEGLLLLATWRDSMRFEETLPAPTQVSTLGDPARLELQGGVRLRARQAEGTQEDRLDGERVDLFLARRPVESAAAAEPVAVPAELGRLDPTRLLVRGDGSLETRRREADESAPSVFRIAGPEIEYALGSGEGRVRGPGSLLVAEAAREGRAASTSRFRWEGRLDLLRPASDRVLVHLAEGVELLHAAGEQALSLTSQRMEILFAAQESSSASEGEALPGLGSAGELLQVRGLGRVFVRSDGRDIECDRFDYDAETGVASLSARPGRLVSVLERGSAGPVRAERVRWDLRSGSIELVNVAGVAAP